MEERLVTDGNLRGVQLLVGAWEGHLVDLVRSAHHDLFLVSPFLRRRPLELIARTVGERSAGARPGVRIVTNLRENNLLNNSTDVSALARFSDKVDSSAVVHLPSLHAKVYIADSRAAIVTSANLTNGGLWRNHECGILLLDTGVVEMLRQYMQDFSRLGNIVESSMLAELARETERLRSAQIESERTADRNASARLAGMLAETRDMVLQVRARGKTTTGILSDTIIFLLERQGPLATRAMHPLVQSLHPDICDDEVDRVIDGVHFGKKWKHHVRNAQQQLRRQGKIERLPDGRWALTDSDQRDGFQPAAR